MNTSNHAQVTGKGYNQKRENAPIVLIPAYKPGQPLLALCAALRTSKVFSSIYVVDDGSGSEYRAIFDEISHKGGIVLRHAVNLGKGMALKTGFNAIACDHPDATAVITCDADGQHMLHDILRVAEMSQANPTAMIMGARSIPQTAPWRSRFGNALTRIVMRLFTGIAIKDTQSGLRGIPLSFLPHCLRLKTTGYDYELDMLVYTKRCHLPILECSVEGVYEEGNPSSHFNPLLDSMRIYFIFVRYSSISLTTALIDYVIFAVCLSIGSNLLVAMLGGRSIAAIYQYNMSRSFVFHATSQRIVAIAKYICVLVLVAMLSYTGIWTLVHHLGASPYWVKILVESVLFVLSFLLLRDFVFSKPQQESQ